MNGDEHLLTTRKEVLQFASQFDGESIFYSNAFRLLQLSVNATDREITRRKQAYDISSKTQEPLPDGPYKLFATDLSSNQVDINQLIDSLRDPVHRFYQEFFWFWPLSDNKPNDDRSLQLLMNDEFFQAVKIWENQNSDPKARAVGLHNMAVFFHFAALSGLDKQISGKTEFYWESAFQKWKNLSTLSDFWSLLDNRVREVDDPRLTLNHVKNLRKSLNTIIAFTNAKEATRLAENGDVEGARTLLVPFTRTQIENDGGLDILQLATLANRERLQAANSLAKDKADNDPAHADKAVEALLAEGWKQLNVIDTILPKDETMTNPLRENLLQNAFQCIDAFFNKTNDWEKTWELLKKAKPFAFQSEEKEEILKRVEGLKEFGSNQNYWCCKGYYNNELPPSLFAKLEEARQAFDRQDFDTAIRILETTLTTFNYDPDICRRAIRPPLALSLQRKSIELFTKGMERLDSPRAILKQVIKNISHKSERCMRSLFAIQSNSLEYSARYGNLYCMSCESVITGQYYVGEANDIKFIICPSCNHKDDLDGKAKKDQALPYLLQAKDFLKKANELQPQNKVVASNLELLRGFFEKVFQISVKEPDQKVNNKPPALPPTSLNRAPSEKMPQAHQSNAGLIIFTLFILLACFIIAMTQGNNSNRPSPTSTYDRTLSTSSVPKIAPIYKSPTSQSRLVIVGNTPTPSPSCRYWGSIKTSDKGKFLCVQGTVYNTYWSSGNTRFYLVFGEDSGKFRLFIKDGYYLNNIVNECLRVKGTVFVYSGVPMIEITFDPSGRSKNLYECE